MAELLFTTDAFRPLDRSVRGVPLLLDNGMRLIEPACSWLMHVALVRGRTRSPQTWRAYGEALYDWWQTLEANGWAWDRVSYHEVAAYRDRMLTGPSNHTGRPYARATINGRLRIVALFYRWCAARGMVASVSFSTQDVSVARSRPAPFLAHVDAGGGVQAANELVLREFGTLPRPLAPEAIRRILAPLGARDRLIVEWAALTGLRRMETAGLGKAATRQSSWWGRSSPRRRSNEPARSAPAAAGRAKRRPLDAGARVIAQPLRRRRLAPRHSPPRGQPRPQMACVGCSLTRWLPADELVSCRPPARDQAVPVVDGGGPTPRPEAAVAIHAAQDRHDPAGRDRVDGLERSDLVRRTRSVRRPTPVRLAAGKARQAAGEHDGPGHRAQLPHGDCQHVPPAR